MYEAFYGFREKPFSILPDPSFLYLGATHTMAYAMLEYGVRNRAGFTVITGEVGCGKTTLLRRLLEELGPELRVGLISNAQQDFGELLQWVLMAFGLDYRARSKVELFDTFQQFLIAEYAQGRRTILIIDEAQNLTPQTLEELRMLSNINADKDQLLQLILVGQPQLRGLLRRPDLLQLAQRVSADYHLKPLSLAETIQYIRHRLKLAGRDAPLFTNEACALLHRVTRGVPRLINIIADTALVYGYAEEAPVIDRRLVYAVVKDKANQGSLQLSHLIKRKPKAAAPATADEGQGDWTARGQGAAPAAPGAGQAAERPDPLRPTASVVEFDKDAVRGPLLKRES